MPLSITRCLTYPARYAITAEMDDPAKPIRDRLVAVAAKEEKLRAALQVMQIERDELQVALKVVERLFAIPSDRVAPVGPPSKITMPGMIVEALRGGPLPIAAIAKRIADEHGPQDVNNIRSTAWRIWKVGRIDRLDDDCYILKNSSEGSAQTDPSIDTGGVAERLNAPDYESGEVNGSAPAKSGPSTSVGSNPTASAQYRRDLLSATSARPLSATPIILGR